MIMMAGAVCGKSTGNGVWEFHSYIPTSSPEVLA